MASLKAVNDALKAVTAAEENLSTALELFGAALDEYKDEVRREKNAEGADSDPDEENE